MHASLIDSNHELARKQTDWIVDAFGAEKRGVAVWKRSNHAQQRLTRFVATQPAYRGVLPSDVFGPLLCGARITHCARQILRQHKAKRGLIFTESRALLRLHLQCREQRRVVTRDWVITHHKIVLRLYVRQKHEGRLVDGFICISEHTLFEQQSSLHRRRLARRRLRFHRPNIAEGVAEKRDIA